MKILDVVSAVLEIDGKLLVMRRNKEKPLGGFWELPGGKVDPGETPQVAIEREMMEETNMVVKASDVITAIDWDSGKQIIRIMYVRCELISKDIEPDLIVHDAFKWADQSNILENTFPPSNTEYIKEYFMKKQK